MLTHFREKLVWRTIVFCLAISMIMFACKGEEEIEETICTVSYQSDIYPILDVACTQAGCHNNGSDNGDLTLYSGAKTMVDDGSMWFQVLVTRNMPIGIKLDSIQLDAIKIWIEEGAKEN